MIFTESLILGMIFAYLVAIVINMFIVLTYSTDSFIGALIDQEPCPCKGFKYMLISCMFIPIVNVVSAFFLGLIALMGSFFIFLDKSF